ncbi:MAG: chemotaxis protein MotB [Bdellovibrionales bacterium RIFCSPHIGHO2_01_FULL_40_29]|nr:MAG: chemotaxis protein MotB [Bdellovibrionales bacterium RIFCSPHIGHO2_01_FULL_40_29]OFZ34043.1 MAG: chemotaxis protein MotB [Bdellovibrionales bacterium RIFCSPHIGHO2_02_FULL_40_15]
MAQKKQVIVIKKIYVQGHGHHGGSWKVALADFMTAMMAFFLVMWLIGQSEESKKTISDYFSTPSVIEYNFQNFGAELTLEKLFLDFVNEPLKAFQSFLEPADKTPNVLDMGSAKVVAAFMADKMTDTAKNVTISQDGFNFDIPDIYLFERGTSTPNKKFVEVMERLKQVTSGMQDADIKLTSAMFIQAVPDQKEATAKKVAQERLDLVLNKVKASFEHTTNSIKGSLSIKDKKGEIEPDKLIGFIRVSITQKESTDSKRSRRKLETAFGPSDANKDIYGNFADQVTNQNTRDENSANPANGSDPNLINPVDTEIQRVESETNPTAR